MDLIPSNEYVEFEDRVYNNPQVGVDETNTFIDQLRATQGQQNQQILSDTQALGTDVPSNLGGLTGGESYFTSRYQTAPTVSAAQNLRTAAQAAALNDVLANEQAIWKKRYQDAYRNYQKRQNNGNNPTTDPTEGDVDEDATDTERLEYKENEVVLPEGTFKDPANTGALTGGAPLPTTGSVSGVLIDKNGNRTAMKVYPGKGIEVAGGLSYTKAGAKNFLDSWVKNGGKVSNGSDAPVHDNYSLNMIGWDLY